MLKLKVVIKQDVGCKVYINPDPSEYSDKLHLVNPDLTRVRGIPPEMWDIVGGRVVADIAARLPPVEPRDDLAELKSEVSRHGGRLDAVPRLIKFHVFSAKYKPPFYLTGQGLVLNYALIVLISCVVSYICTK